MKNSCTKSIPVLYLREEECCGCTACYAICPNQAIKMVSNEEGFEYPIIEKEKCISCQLCKSVCPMKK